MDMKVKLIEKYKAFHYSLANTLYRHYGSNFLYFHSFVLATYNIMMCNLI